MSLMIVQVLVYTYFSDKCIATGVGFRKVSDCTCSGITVTFECTTMGPGSTVWILGSSNECEINLRHSQFRSGTAIGRCFNDLVEAVGIYTDGNFYTSQLNISFNANFIGETVRCDYDNGASPATIRTEILRLSSEQGFFNLFCCYYA